MLGHGVQRPNLVTVRRQLRVPGLAVLPALPSKEGNADGRQPGRGQRYGAAASYTRPKQNSCCGILSSPDLPNVWDQNIRGGIFRLISEIKVDSAWFG